MAVAAAAGGGAVVMRKRDVYAVISVIFLTRDERDGGMEKTRTLPTNRTEPPLRLALPARRRRRRRGHSRSRRRRRCCRSGCRRRTFSCSGSGTCPIRSRRLSRTLRRFSGRLSGGRGFRLGLCRLGDDGAARTELDHVDRARAARNEVTAREEDYLWAAVSRCLQERVTVTRDREERWEERGATPRSAPTPHFFKGKKRNQEIIINR